MAPLPVISNVFRCVFNWTAGGQNAVNVIHVRPSSPPATPLEVFTCLDTNIPIGLFTLQTLTASIPTVDITPLDGASATQTFSTGSPARWSGGLTGEFIPAASNLIKLQTALRGRSNRGRVFLPFLAEGAQADGVISDASVAGLGTSWGTFVGAIAADSTTPMTLVVASYKLALANDVVALSAEKPLGTQRRRQSRLR